jgi:spore maturation protein CgeB
MSNVGQIDLYRKSGCSNPTYWQIGYDPKLYYPKNKKQFKYDVSFIGNNYNRMFPDSKMRTAIAESVKRKFGARAGVFGGTYNKKLKIGSCKMTDSNDIYNDSVCVLSISNFNDVGHYFSDRMLMCLASGRPTISWRFPGSESYFAERGDFLVARSEQDVFNLIQECKDNPEWANNIGRNGHLKVLAEHTFDSRVLELFAITGLSGML